jgi:hypothetical protein
MVGLLQHITRWRVRTLQYSLFVANAHLHGHWQLLAYIRRHRIGGSVKLPATGGKNCKFAGVTFVLIGEYSRKVVQVHPLQTYFS